MATVTSRRSFLENSGMVNNSQDFFTTSDPVIAFNANESPFAGYNPFAAVKNDLRMNPFGKHVEVTGRIFDQSGTIPLSDISMEVWHLSADSEEFSHRARLYTDSSGNYRFITDLPAREMGRSFRIYFKITIGGRNYYTKLVFNHCLFWIATRHKITRVDEQPDGLDYSAIDNSTEQPFLLNIKLHS